MGGMPNHEMSNQNECGPEQAKLFCKSEMGGVGKKKKILLRTSQIIPVPPQTKGKNINVLI